MRFLLGTGSQNPTAVNNLAPNLNPGANAFGGPSVQGMNAGAVNFGDNPLGGMLSTMPKTGGGLGGLPTLNALPGGEGFSAPLTPQGGRINSVFGNTGIQATPLQRQSTGGISQFLNQPSPETRTFDQLQPGLMALFSGQTGGVPANVQNFLGNTLSGGGNLLPPEVLASLTRAASGSPGNFGFSGTGIGQPGVGEQTLEEIAKQAPGQGVLDALQPHFQRNLALANQAGGRFGTANAFGRSEAVNDFNLLGAQAAAQGQDQRLKAAQALGLLQSQRGMAGAAGQGLINQSQSQAIDALLRSASGGQGLQQGAAGLLGSLSQGAQGGQLAAGGLLGQLAGQSGQNDFSRLVQGFGVGSGQATQNDVETQRNLGILMNMFGGLSQATLGAPTQTTPNGFQQGAGLGSSIGQILALLNPQKKANG